MRARWTRSVTTVVPLLALLATTLLAMMVAMDAGLSLCPGNDMHAEMGGREVTICPVVLGLIVASASSGEIASGRSRGAGSCTPSRNFQSGERQAS